MNNIYEKVKLNPLFEGINETDFVAMLSCLNGNMRSYDKHDIVLLAGERIDNVGLVTSGAVHVLREDENGKQNLIAELGNGEIFGEVFACIGILRSPVTVQAATASEVLHINYKKIITACTATCPFHQRLIENMLALIAKKNLMLNHKIEILSKRTTRDRLVAFFDFHRRGEKHFALPYNREELAAYLCVDRSAMSAELSRMQRDGLIKYSGNSVEML